MKCSLVKTNVIEKGILQRSKCMAINVFQILLMYNTVKILSQPTADDRAAIRAVSALTGSG